MVCTTPVCDDMVCCAGMYLYTLPAFVWKVICSPCVLYSVLALRFINSSYMFSLDHIFRHVLRSLLGVDNRLRSQNVYLLFNCTSILNLLLYKCLAIFNNFSHSNNYILCFLVHFVLHMPISGLTLLILTASFVLSILRKHLSVRV